MNKYDCRDTKADRDNRRQQQTNAFCLGVSGQSANCQYNGNASQDINDGGHLPASHGSLESGRLSILHRIGEVVDFFLQRLALRLKFTYLLLEGRVLRLQLDNLSERNRQLKVRLLGLRRWHVQYPPVDETDVSAVEHEPKAGAVLEPREEGRLGSAVRDAMVPVKPNV